jgi:hypothetical protein
VNEIILEARIAERVRKTLLALRIIPADWRCITTSATWPPLPEAMASSAALIALELILSWLQISRHTS